MHVKNRMIQTLGTQSELLTVTLLVTKVTITCVQNETGGCCPIKCIHLGIYSQNIPKL
jgi:hypothetical protein